MLKIRNLNVSYGNVPIIKNVSFDVAPGQIVGIVGESCSGKSTVANLAAGLIPATSGEITFLGEHMQMVFQDPLMSFSPKMKNLREEMRMSYLFISHDLALVSSVCDRIAVMYEGRILEEGPVREILDHPKKDYTKKLLDAVLKI